MDALEQGLLERDLDRRLLLFEQACAEDPGSAVAAYNLGLALALPAGAGEIIPAMRMEVRSGVFMRDSSFCGEFLGWASCFLIGAQRAHSS